MSRFINVPYIWGKWTTAIRVQPSLPSPEPRILQIGTDPCRKHLWQLEACPNYTRLPGILGVGKYSCFLNSLVSNPWTQRERLMCVGKRMLWKLRMDWMSHWKDPNRPLPLSPPGEFVRPGEIPDSASKCPLFMTSHPEFPKEMASSCTPRSLWVQTVHPLWLGMLWLSLDTLIWNLVPARVL